MTLSLFYLCLTVLCKCSTLGASDVFYHIKPSTNASCPEEPCLTLSQFASQAGLYLESNTTLLFLPGQHNLSLELNFTAVSKLSMTSKPTLSKTASAIIACEGRASLTFSSIDKVYVGYLTFSGCYGHESISVQMFVLENTSFLNHRGSALKFVSSTAKIAGSSFIANSLGSYQQGQTIFSENHYLQEYDDFYAYSGAALSLTHSSVDILQCIFKENSAELGGAIFGKLQSQITIVNTIFEQNHVICTYIGFESKACIGAVLYSANGTVDVYNSTFYNNTLMNEVSIHLHVYQYGGVFALFYSKLKVEHSILEHNRARGYSSDSYGGAIHACYSIVNISHSEFTSNWIGAYGGVMSMSNSVCSIINSRFVNNSVLMNESIPYFGGGGVLHIQHVNMTIINSMFKENTAYSCTGGVMLIDEDFNNFISIIDSNFTSNSALLGGVLYIDTGDIIIVNIVGCEFSTNSAELSGGVIKVEHKYRINIHVKSSKFIKNIAGSSGGVLHMIFGIVIFCESEFVENSAQYYGGVVFAEDSSINFYCTTIKDNTANRGTISLFHSSGILSNVTLAGNIGSVFIYLSNLTFIDGIITNCSPSLNTNETQTLSPGNIDPDKAVITTYPEGGAITMFQSTILLKGECTLTRNNAELGGAIHATESKIYAHNKTTISHNRASDSGGGVYMYQSELNCYISRCDIVNNTCGNKGGGIHAISSTIVTRDTGIITFKGNHAEEVGGGVCLELNSKLYMSLYKDTNTGLKFKNNSANYGGAVYIADETNSGTCASESYEIQSTTTECFIQPLSFDSYLYFENTILVMFINNDASISGLNLFGGLLDRCTISPFAYKRIVQDITDGAKYLNTISNIHNYDSITSSPVRVCFCNTSHHPDCSYHLPPVQIEKGKLFTVPLVAVDQVNHTIPNVTIRSSLSSSSGGLGENQLSQSTGESCTHLEFKVFSQHTFEQLILYADGPCKDAPMSQSRVEIEFTPCTCPLGFQTNVDEKTKCDCECNSDLLPYVTKCDPKTETIVRETNFWIDYIGGYLVYPHCPLDYCKPSEDKVKINLNVENGADVQCANHRTGLLCGTCLSGYSLSLGSSRCIPCPSYWPVVTVALILASVVVGVLFVALLLLLNLTVAAGTLNGIIYYGNVMAANRNTVFPSNVFISWLNLELGCDICFIKGMDVYWKTWLQLAFPTYLIFLVVMVIIISERSERFTRLIGRKDPVATLATLVLLSYSKLLHTIIASLSGTVLKFPGPNYTREEVVWLPDASIKYLSGKHIPLFIVAVLILLGGILYTTILFHWQWILGLRLFRWLNNTQKLSLFIQTYHVPYVPKHRYWTGLLLLARIVLHIVSSANVKGDPKINLTAIGVVVVSTMLLRDFVEFKGRIRIYHQESIEMLEIACHLNLVLLCIVTFLTLEQAKASAIVAHISVSVSVALLLAVLLYHVFTEVIFKTKVWRNYKERQQSPIIICDAPTNEQMNIQIHVPSHSIVDGPKRSSQKISKRKEVGDMSRFDGELKEILIHADQNVQYS